MGNQRQIFRVHWGASIAFMLPDVGLYRTNEFNTVETFYILVDRDRPTPMESCDKVFDS